MGRKQKPPKQFFGNRIGKELAADIAASVDRAIYRLTLIIRKPARGCGNGGLRHDILPCLGNIDDPPVVRTGKIHPAWPVF